jgi:hypothetical protein
MKRLVEFDLDVEKPVKKVAKRAPKKKVEEVVEVVEERPVTGGKSVPEPKPKKPPTEKQLAARERMKLARQAKIAEVKAQKEKLEEEIRLKNEEIAKKKAEILEKRKKKREEERLKKAAEPQLPVSTSGPILKPEIVEKKPTIKETLTSINTKTLERVEDEEAVEEEPVTPKQVERFKQPPGAPRKHQSFFYYPFGKKVEMKQRLR